MRASKAEEVKSETSTRRVGRPWRGSNAQRRVGVGWGKHFYLENTKARLTDMNTKKKSTTSVSSES